MSKLTEKSEVVIIRVADFIKQNPVKAQEIISSSKGNGNGGKSS